MIKEKRFSKALIAVALAAVMVLSVVIGIALCGANEPAGAESSRVGENILLAKGDKVTLMSGGDNEKYNTLVYGTAPHTGVAGTANTLSDDWFYKFSKKMSATKESASTPTTNVVTYGRVTNVALSVKLADTIDAYPETSVVWGIAYDHQTGVLALYANSKAALEATKSKTSSGHALYLDLYTALEEYIEGTSFVVTEELFRVFELTEAEYNAIIAEDNAVYEAEQEALKAAEIERLKAEIKKFDTAEFAENPGIPDPDETDELTTDFGKASSGDPHYYPTVGEHPRVLFTSDDVPAIKERIESLNGTAEYKLFTKYLKEEVTGILPPAYQHGTNGFHNWSSDVLSRIQINALGYAVYGEELYGYKAIYAMKNYLLTLDIDCIRNNQERQFGLVMYVAACVYDWCYDLLSAEDKYQIALGVEHRICRGKTNNESDLIIENAMQVRMEMGFPPTKQFAGSGHGAEFQLQRDYLAMAIAIYDEVPGWYEFVAGRFYNEYVPIHNAYYSAGLYPQGMSCYAPWRFLADCFGGALIQSATGISPYSTDIADVVFTFLANEASSKVMFSTGDGTFGAWIPQAAIKQEALVISHMLYDTNAAPLLRLIESGLSGSYTGSSVSTVMPAEYFIFSAREVEELEDTTWRDELPLITYTGNYVGQYISRNEWTDNGAVVMMKMNVRPTGNHDHQEAGTFQIHYKGLTSGSSGGYGIYGTDHWQYYHQTTVSHNGLLVFDPSKADTEPQQVMNADGSPKLDSYGNVIYSNEARLFYTGGQRMVPHVTTLEQWANPTFDNAIVTGYNSGYYYDGVTPKFAYLAGDITNAYTSAQATYVGRTMLTAYTGDADVPMVMFVLDRVDAADESFIKKFLLQINGENAPVVDHENMTVTVEEGDGQLVLQNVLGGTKIEELGGGYGNNYIINGVNCQDVSFSKQNAWGRVEVWATGNKSDLMLNVIYVSDKGNNQLLKAESITGVDKRTGTKKMLEGATIGNTTALFSTEIDRTVEEIVFTAKGEGVMTYYIGGLFEGTWRVSIDGKYEGSVYSTKDSGMITFEAPAGKEITITPGADIRPAGSEKLTYMTGGGTLGKNAPSFYMPGENTKLTTDIVRGTDLFDGWYLDPEFTQKVEYLDESITGPVIVYAKWTSLFANEDYSDTNVSMIESTSGNLTENNIIYSIVQAITTFETRGSGEDKYLFFQTKPNTSAGNGGDGPSIFVRPETSSIATIEADQVTYIFKLASGGTGKEMDFSIRVRNNENPQKQILMFNVSGGKISFGGKTIAELKDEFVTISVTLDFATGTMKAYTSANADCLTSSFSATDRTKFTTEILSLRANSAGAVKVGKIMILEGDHAATISDTDKLNNKIVFPEEAIIPAGTNNAYTPDAGTPIPKEGITADFNGVIYKLAGWYSDAELTQEITTVPDGVTGVYRVYAKWAEPDVIVYPSEVISSAALPKEYTSGTAITLPTAGIKGTLYGKTVDLIGWYEDPELTIQITEISANASGIVHVYAKWAEPNVIVYPDNVKFTADYPLDYVAGETVLPTPEYSGEYNATFIGWYSDPQYKNKITTIPQGAEGLYPVYAAFEEVFFELDVNAEGTGTVIGYGYCYEHTDVNKDNICDTCKYCIGLCTDANSDGKCDTCNYNVKLCGIYADNHTDSDSDGRCDVCNVSLSAKSSSGSLGLSGVTTSFLSFVPGYVTVVDNGNDDYIEIFEKMGDGPSLNFSGKGSINDFIGGRDVHRLVYTFNFAAKEGETLLPIAIRPRINGSTPWIFYINEDGKMTTGDSGSVIEGYTIGTEMTTVHIVVDFDREELRYYIGDSVDPAAKRAFSRPGQYADTDTWIESDYSAGSTGVFQMRYQSTGTIRVGDISITSDNSGRFAVNENQIKYPEAAKLPTSAPKSYVAGETALPTEATATIGGVKYDLVGWYSDSELTNKITVIPAGASGEYPVYAKWEEHDYVIYPDEAILPAGMPSDYTAGVATPLPTEGVTGNVSGKVCPLVGWYSDAELTQQITEIPATANGAFRVYAKWQEPSVISYPANATLPAGAPEDYVAGETELPTPTYNGTGDFTFGGWYSDASCTTKITKVPEGTVGVFKPFALWTKTVLDVDPVASNETGTAIGYGYCFHADANGDGKCDTCERCAATDCIDVNTDHKCDTCQKCICEYPNNVAGASLACNHCGTTVRTVTGSLGIKGLTMSYSGGTPGYATVVDNGDNDYVELFIKNGSGSCYNLADESAGTAAALLKGLDRRVLVYSFELAAKEGESIMSLAMRFRPANSPQQFLVVNQDGTFSDGVKTISGPTLTTTMAKVTVAVDFDNEQIRYYFGNSTEAVHIREYTKPADYATVDEWVASYNIGNYGFLQMRMQTPGVILVGDVSISIAAPEYIAAVSSK